jgi:hypothetical protein
LDRPDDRVFPIGDMDVVPLRGPIDGPNSVHMIGLLE